MVIKHKDINPIEKAMTTLNDPDKKQVLYVVSRPSHLFLAASLASIDTNILSYLLIINNNLKIPKDLNSHFLEHYHFHEWPTIYKDPISYYKSLTSSLKPTLDHLRHTFEFDSIVIMSDLILECRIIISALRYKKLGVYEDGLVLYLIENLRTAFEFSKPSILDLGFSIISSILYRRYIPHEKGYGQAFLSDAFLSSYSCREKVRTKQNVSLDAPLFISAFAYNKKSNPVNASVKDIQIAFIGEPLVSYAGVNLIDYLKGLRLIGQVLGLNSKNIGYFPHPGESQEQLHAVNSSGYFIAPSSDTPVEMVMMSNRSDVKVIIGVSSTALLNLTALFPGQIISLGELFGIKAYSFSIFRSRSILLPEDYPTYKKMLLSAYEGSHGTGMSDRELADIFEKSGEKYLNLIVS